MEKQTKNLGHVTAYGYAKSQGYEGTEAEYAQLMASYATVAERAEAAADAAEESAQEVKDVIPEVTAQDNGKVMMVENGAWGAGEVDVLPPVTSQDNGKVLGVVEGQWAPAEPEDGLPSVTSSDNGKVLSVVEGEWAPAEPTGGSGLPAVTSEDNGDLLSVVDGAWAKSEPGYRAAMVDGTVIIPEQEVTTVTTRDGIIANISDFNPPDDPSDLDAWPETLAVTFDGTEYTCPRGSSSSGSLLLVYYGEDTFNPEPDPSAPPFLLTFSSRGSLAVYTLSAGTYTIKAATPPVRDVIPSSDFKLAVNACGAPGYDVSTGEVETAAEQSVTTASDGTFIVGQFAATVPDPLPDSINVTFDGTSYANLPKHADASLGGMDIYGDIAFSEYPFAIVLSSAAAFLFTQAAGTYDIAITRQSTIVTPNDNFKAAVEATGLAPFVVTYTFYLDAGSTPPAVTEFSCDKTYAQIEDAINSGRTVIAYLEQRNGQPPLPMQRVSPDADAGFQFASISPFYDSQTGSLTLSSVSIEHTADDDYIYYSGSVAATDVEVYHKPS